MDEKDNYKSEYIKITSFLSQKVCLNGEAFNDKQSLRNMVIIPLIYI